MKKTELIIKKIDDITCPHCEERFTYTSEFSIKAKNISTTRTTSEPN